MKPALYRMIFAQVQDNFITLATLFSPDLASEEFFSFVLQAEIRFKKSLT